MQTNLRRQDHDRYPGMYITKVHTDGWTICKSWLMFQVFSPSQINSHAIRMRAMQSGNKNQRPYRPFQGRFERPFPFPECLSTKTSSPCPTIVLHLHTSLILPLQLTLHLSDILHFRTRNVLSSISGRCIRLSCS